MFQKIGYASSLVDRLLRCDFAYLTYRIKWWLVSRFDIVLQSPLHVDIELTEACNLKCVMCVHGIEGVPDTGMMDSSLAKDIIDQAKALKIPSIKFNWRGEPGLHKDLVDLVRYAKQAGIIDVQINTNGTALSKRRWDQLVDAGIDRIIFSMDGASKETYEAIRIGAKFEHLCSAIEHVLKKKTSERRAKPEVRLQMVAMKSNQDDVGNFIANWKDKVDEISVKPVTDRGQGNQLATGHWISTGRKRCNQPWQRLVVARDGKIFPCCSDWNMEFQVGNATTESLAEVWKGSRMEEMRQLNRDKMLDNFEPCKSCFVTSSYTWRQFKPSSEKSDLIPTKNA